MPIQPSASVTAKKQPVEAGVRDVDPNHLAAVVSNLTNALMEAGAATLNPRTPPELVSSLSNRAAKLQERLHHYAAKLDTVSTPAERMDLANDLNTLGAEVQDYVNAVYEALKDGNPGLQIAGLRGGETDSITPWYQTPKFMWIAGTLAVVIGAGIAWHFAKKKKNSYGRKQFGKLPGVILAK